MASSKGWTITHNKNSQNKYTTYTLTCKGKDFDKQNKKVTLQCGGLAMTGDLNIEVEAKGATFTGTPTDYSGSFTPSATLSAMTLTTTGTTWNPTLYPITNAGWITTAMYVYPKFTVNTYTKPGKITSNYITFHDGWHAELGTTYKNSIIVLLENGQSWYTRDDSSASWIKCEWGEGTVIRWNAVSSRWDVTVRNGSSTVGADTWWYYVKADTKYQSISISLTGLLA